MLKEAIPPFEEYDSDEDPPYIPPPIFDPELDYDEYSDGEIQVGVRKWKLAYGFMTLELCRAWTPGGHLVC